MERGRIERGRQEPAWEDSITTPGALGTRRNGKEAGRSLAGEDSVAGREPSDEKK